MQLKKIFRILKNWNLLKLHTCELLVVDATPEKGSRTQIRTLYVKTSNVLFIYVNGKRVKLNTSYKAAPLDNNNYIIIKVKALFNSKTKKINIPNQRIEINKDPFSMSEKLKFISLKKKVVWQREREMKSNIYMLRGKQNKFNLAFKKVFQLRANYQTIENFNNQ
tara:strand:- start:5830 stop:6324 length:495 start_codon:yes stop_codon:yes gene_type:complete